MSEIDDLMDQDPLSLSNASLDAIITYHRNQRAAWAEQDKTGKKKPVEKIKSIDLGALFPSLKKPPTPPKTPGGMRRI